MAERRAWSRAEVEAIVADYFDMLAKELRGEPYSKAEHRRRLMRVLQGRSEGAIEYKHQNITAVLNELGWPGIDGYKPAKNYQDLLFEVVSERLTANEGLADVVADVVQRPAPPPRIDDILARLVDVPRSAPRPRYGRVRERGEPRPVTTNYLLKEARNTSLGTAGEEFVLAFERARLIAAREERLAASVEHVAQTRGDHEGYDVLSYDVDGRERLIEVKTTTFGPLTPFFVSANQVRTSERHKERYHVYRVFRFRKDPHLFALRGAVGVNFDLEATEFLARPA